MEIKRNNKIEIPREVIALGGFLVYWRKTLRHAI